jgi:hypothetical protein
MQNACGQAVPDCPVEAGDYELGQAELKHAPEAELMMGG